MGQKLGQHFLASRPILERIAAAACPDPTWTAVEIGPGKGALTDHLIPLCSHLHAVELDQVLVHYLQQKFHSEPKFDVAHADVLQFDLTQWGPVSVIGNLPYYITSPIVEKVLSLGPLLRQAVFLVQKEVAERIAASPGTRDYGYLSVQCQLLAETKLLFTVPPGAFRPPPNVDSAVVRLLPRAHPLVSRHAAFLEFASAAFRQKRKTLRNNLAAAYSKEILSEQPEASMRAEQLSVGELVGLWDRLSNLQQVTSRPAE